MVFYYDCVCYYELFVLCVFFMRKKSFCMDDVVKSVKPSECLNFREGKVLKLLDMENMTKGYKQLSETVMTEYELEN